jgi:ABC-2 type transport system ATP-binding protein
MNVIQVDHIAKYFGEIQAVKDVSFEVHSGEIMGLLGPNGAGKTTTIRVILDLFKPDSGRAEILGGVMDESKLNRIGYMPEERGLYQDIPLERCLTYLATLKGMSAADAHSRLEQLLRRFELEEHRKKQVKALSKGMQQKAQIISTIIHDPDVIIIDEPFAALDPLNTQLVKDLMQELRTAGKSILMSTHQMHQVEELCDRIVLIDKGTTLLYGDLQGIRRKYSGEEVLIRTREPMPKLRGVAGVSPHNDAVKLTLEAGTTPDDLLRQLLERGAAVERFELAIPELDEIFIRVVKGDVR